MRVLTALVLEVAALPAAAVQADPPQRADRPAGEIAAYWTKERMRAAVPRDAVRGGEPRPAAGKPGGGGGSSSWTSLAVTPIPYAGADLANGKVFLTIEGVNYVCSGTSVAATAGVNLVWTAGHCLNEGPGDYATNFMFAPGYLDGATPYGKWSFTALLTTPRWRTNGDFDYDLGAARVVPGDGAPPSGTLADIALPRPMAFNYPVAVNSTRMKSYGYPAAGKFNGQRLWLCDSTVSRRDGSGAGDPMGIGCDMTPGSSGGGWMNASGAVASVNSYFYRQIKNVMHGPYQGTAAQALYESMD